MTSTADVSEPRLRCRECGAEASATGPQYCDRCFGPVEVVLADPGRPSGEVSALIEAGPASLARYGALLPRGLDLGGVSAGWTPLVRAPDLGRAIGLDDLWIKDETANPTGSFKDRVVEVAVARGAATGSRAVACSSTGNLARATAAAASRRGMAAIVLVPEHLDDSTIAELASLGATVVAVRGGYDAASRLAAEAAGDLDRWAWVNVTLRPWYELGARTTGWEIVEQSGWRMPDRVAAPVASGALARALHESMAHLAQSGLVSGVPPRLTALQPAGCAPVARAFASGADVVTPLAHPETVAASLAMGDPPDGHAVLAAARSTGGSVQAVDEDAILDAAELVRSTTGVAVEPAGGVVIAGLAALVAAGTVNRDEMVVAVLSGAAPPSRSVDSTGASAEVVPGRGLAGTIDASVAALTEVLPDHLLR
ncbi:MAG: threonine synthase [Acidimicrobiales bacterium]|nr:threonine synthase [Acidimicrobiales bacterium]